MSITSINTPEEFKSIVLESSVPVVVDFYATWCGPCKQLLPVMESVSDMVDESVAKVVKINVDDVNVDIVAAEYNIRSLPSVLRFVDGEEVARNIGPMQKMDVIKFIRGNE